jgi:hypothetical protein
MMFVKRFIRLGLASINVKIFIPTFGILLSGLLFWLISLGNAVVRTESCGTVGTLQNGSFENGSTSWRTTATDGAFEIWGPSSTTRPNSSTFNISDPSNDYTKDGQYLAEPQANGGGGSNQGLYQDITTTPGAQIFISFWHHHRQGYGTTQTLTARVGAVPAGIPAGSNWTSTEQNDSTSFGTAAASNSAVINEDWEQARAVYTVPSNQTSTRFLFISSGSTPGGGNLVDDIDFTPFLACPVTRSVTFGSADTLNAVTTAGVTYGIDQTITSITSASNPNGSAGTASRSNNVITFNPAVAGSGQTVDYTASMTFNGTTYTDEARITYDVAATVPASPTALTGTPNGSSFPLSWTAPSNNGGVAISDYVVEYSTDGTNWVTWNDGINTNTSTTITGLNASNSYRFRVSAKNDGSSYSGPGTTGTSAPSTVLTVSFCPNLNSMNGITGMILWLRADCVNGTPTQPSDGASITRWEDLSPENHDATQVSGQTAPTFQNDSGNLINSQPVLNFTRTSNNAGSVFQVDGVDIRATTNPDVSIFVVYKPRRVSGDAAEINGVWGADNGGWDRFFLSKFQNFGNDGLISLGPGSSNTTTARVTNSAVDGTTRLLTAIYDGTVSGNANSGPENGSKIYFGSTLITSFTDTTHPSDALSRLYIGWDGDDSAFRGDIAEFIVFDRALESDLPTINQYLNDRYNLQLDVSTNLPTVLLVDPKRTTLNLPSLALSNSTNAMICFEQVANSGGTALGGSANISVTRTTSVENVTSTVATNSWRYSGSRANVQTQINSIQITGTSGNPVANNGSKWVRIRVTDSTTDCASDPVQRVVEIRPLGFDGSRRVTVTLN